MDTSLDRICQLVYTKNQEEIPDFVVAQIGYSMFMAIRFLEINCFKVRRRSYSDIKSNIFQGSTSSSSSPSTTMGMITPFTAVKTSNILISRDGSIKLCDLGMSRHLVDKYATNQFGAWYHYIAVSFLQIINQL